MCSIELDSAHHIQSNEGSIKVHSRIERLTCSGAEQIVSCFNWKMELRSLSRRLGSSMSCVRRTSAQLLCILVVQACVETDRSSPKLGTPEACYSANELEWRLADAPMFDVGADAGGEVELLDEVTSAVRLSNGDIVIASGGDHSIRIFSDRGTLVRQIGREGQGPGEFSNAPWVGRYGTDSLLAWDSGSRRISVFTSQGVLVRDWEVTGLGLTPNAVGLFADGSLIVERGFLTSGLSALPPGLRRDSADFYIIASDSSSPRPFVRVLGPERYVSTSGGKLTISPAPFGRATLVAIGAELAAVGDNEGQGITLFERNGQLRRRFEIVSVAASLSEDDIESYRQQRADAVTSPEFQAELRAMLEEVPFPETTPLFTRLKFGADEQLWVELGAAPKASHSQWIIVDSLGSCVASLLLPADDRLLDVGSKWALILARGALGVEHVQLYEIEK